MAQGTLFATGLQPVVTSAPTSPVFLPAAAGYAVAGGKVFLLRTLPSLRGSLIPISVIVQGDNTLVNVNMDIGIWEEAADESTPIDSTYFLTGLAVANGNHELQPQNKLLANRTITDGLILRDKGDFGFDLLWKIGLTFTSATDVQLEATLGVWITFGESNVNRLATPHTLIALGN